VASLLAAPAAAREAASGGAGAAVPEIAWTSWGADAPGFECATVRVPLDHDRPKGAKISLALTRLRSEQGAYDTLQAFLRLCDAGGPNCAFSEGNPKRRYDRLARRLLAEPAQLPDGQGGTVPFTYADLVATTLGVLYSPTDWPPFAEFLQELDTLTSPARAAAVLRGLRQRLGLGARALRAGPRGLRRGLVPRPGQPRPLLGLGAGRPPGRPPRPLLRPAVDLVRQHLRPVAGPRP
jgi:hypothetical protein